MKLQDYLRTHGLDALCANFAIKAVRHKTYPDLVLLKYDQIHSPMSYTVVQQCRGIILDEANDWRIIARPYDKFFNYGEGNAANIDWGNACVYEKLDGSLMFLYPYAGQWHVASSGSPDASGTVGLGGSETMAALFWRVWDELGYQLPLPGDIGHTFMFELMTPANRVVVPHQQSRIVLHGVRECSEAGYELPSAWFGHGGQLGDRGWEVVKMFPLWGIDNIVLAAQFLDPMECEGYVVVDGLMRRVKVKSPAYVALHHMKEKFSTRRMVELVQANESAEFLTYFPEYRAQYEDVKGRHAMLVEEHALYYQDIQGIAEQKQFALRAQQAQCSGALFAVRSGKAASITEFFARLPSDKLCKMLGLRDVEPVPAG